MAWSGAELRGLALGLATAAWIAQNWERMKAMYSLSDISRLALTNGLMSSVAT
jgi:hypothetical protein